MYKITLNSSPGIMQQAVDASLNILEEGGIIVAPTETAYGLLVNARDQEAMRRLFEFKQRPLDKPTAVFIESEDQLKDYGVELEEKQFSRIGRFWPGPVTFVLKSSIENWPGVVSADGKIGFRCSSHPFIKSLIGGFKVPISATSANISGKMPASIADIESNFAGKIELFIIDPVLNFNSPPSTVVELVDDDVKILRKGAVDSKLIKEIFAYG
ncbi:MAG TPA: threonylcarbamoyl-AMP synthase [candidate division Zixibacteria bacterium]|nr:threonylcarbamoyl-AMP synthase [candidate division Zixibacteria bacterium]